MRFLIFALCLALAGCATHGHKHAKSDGEFKLPIQQVLDQRKDIRAVISHAPATDQELAAAGMDPNALIFKAQDFVTRLKDISLDDCPFDFKDAFTNYITAWEDRAAADPNLLVIVSAHPQDNSTKNENGTITIRRDILFKDAERTEAAWKAVQTVCMKYGVEAD